MTAAPIAECSCPRVRHRHGTEAGYRAHHCRCPQCRAVNAKAHRRLRRRRAYGTLTVFVDAEPARRRVRAAMKAGVGWMRFADQAGVTHSTVRALLYGTPSRDVPPTGRLVKANSDRLLSAQPVRSPFTRVDATGTRRRLQALVAIGWCRRELGRRLGVKGKTEWNIFRAGKVTVRTARAVRVLFDELSMTLPPQTTTAERGTATKTRNSARRHGWAPPLAWDDEDIDDPRAVPRGIGLMGSYTNDLDDPVTFYHRQGLNDHEIARQISRRREAVASVRNRLGLQPNARGRPAA